MYDGSLATRGPWEALVTFQQLLVLADRFGEVDMTAAVISRRTTIPEDIIKRGLEVLQTPDQESRRAEEQGRRIVPLDPGRSWGWRIVNYQHYHSIRSAEERRDYQRAYMRTRRAAGKDKARQNTKSQPAEPLIPEWLDGEKWSAWMAIRPARARTPAAKRAALEKLESLRAAGHDANAILADSLANGWHGLFAPAKPQKLAPSELAPRPAITCRECGIRAYTWTDGKCNPCWEKQVGQ